VPGSGAPDEPALGIKFTVRRAFPAGHPLDDDVYNTQWHVPVLAWEIDV